jgi:hypothetical protein
MYPARNGKTAWSLLLEDLHFPIQRIPFGPMQLPIPNNAAAVLKREYGDDWHDIAYLQYSHELERPLPSVKVPILDFSPPEYVLRP